MFQDDTPSPILRLQRMVKTRFHIRLHCKNLAERLLYEDSLRRGLFRLLNQGSIFVLLLIAQSFTGYPSARRGIYNNLSKRAVRLLPRSPPPHRVPILLCTLPTIAARRPHRIRSPCRLSKVCATCL